MMEDEILTLIQDDKVYQVQRKNTAAGNRSSERGEEFWVTLYSRKSEAEHKGVSLGN